MLSEPKEDWKLPNPTPTYIFTYIDPRKTWRMRSIK